MNTIGSYEDSHAATVEMAALCVDTAIKRIESAYALWREAEADPASSTMERSERLRILNIHRNEFALQWANVKFVTDDLAKNVTEIAEMLQEVLKGKEAR